MTESQTNIAHLFAQAAKLAFAFRAGLDERPQRPEVDYAEALAAFEMPTPQTGEPAEAVLEDLVRRATPGLHATTGSRFFGWVIGGSHPVGVVADWMTSTWGQNAGNHTASPSAAACETVAARWLLDLLDLPREASVGFVTGATVANFVALAAARSEVLLRLGWNVEAKGLFDAPPIQVLIGDAAHSTVFSALQYLGLGHERVTRVATDREGAMLPDAFTRVMRNVDWDAPLIVVTQAGQINTGAFDPYAAIIDATRVHSNCWIHVDGAFGLWARACPARAALADGIEGADSWATDGHKWLQTPYDCGYAIVRNADAHRRAMMIAASYLPSVGDGERDPSHYVPELSRRARGFATWAMLRHYGREGIAALVERHCHLARLIADTLRGEPGIAIVNDVVLNQVILRFGAGEEAQKGDDLTRRTITALQRDGTCFAGGAQWQGRWVMRLSLIGCETSEADALRSASAIVQAWREVREG
ncbi:pyridoxal phosphate-dependent decarboxylase family protein [Labrys okinawensis]|uniref:pyridoxal phosphate-dependent decarboxylase family protein n=1 Tax=Labrys okinawensis TaxID=346911 RepID=UPI0039BCC9FB